MHPVFQPTDGNTVPAGYYKIVSNALANVNVTYTNAYSDVSYSYYNQLGQLIATIAPEGVKKLYGTGINNYATKDNVPFITLYEYDTQGRLVSTKSSDASKGEIVYSKDGKVRFSQDGEQKLTNKYSYTNYDPLGRPIESGEMVSGGIAFNSDLTATTNPMRDILEDVSISGGLTTGTKADVVTTLYDIPDGTHGQSGYSQDVYTLRGAVSMTRKSSSVTGAPPYASTNLMSVTWYNYDEEGKVLWTIKRITGPGGTNTKKTQDYSYNALGQLIKLVTQKNTAAETFVHYYEYDPANLQLWKVYTNTVDNSTTKTLQATYIYYLHGPLKRVELATDLQGIDYTYTLQGALKAINNNDKTKDPGGDGATVKTDAFGMVLDYYPNDYVNSRVSGIQTIKGVNTSSIVPTESYAGNIKAMSWFSKKPAAVLLGNQNAEDPTAYVFNYDDKYQFTESTWGTTLNFASTPATFTTNTFNKEKIKDPSSGVPGYDANGNIKFLQRTDVTGLATDNFSYNYTLNTNKLASVMQNTSTTYATYTYDQIGQLTIENTGAAANKKYIKYDVTGKVIMVARDAAFSQKVVEYEYDELGQRILKRNFNASSPYQHIQNTYYVDGVIYTQSVTGGVGGAITAQEYTVDGGAGSLGTFYRPTSIYAYEMTDHLGNVRAVIAKSAGNLEIRVYSDYYPYGSVIQNNGTYRKGYQGKYSEKDAETDWNAFELRMYDSKIARWLTVDPQNEFWSPYVAMGNDPISLTDPTGGETDPDCPECLPAVVFTAPRNAFNAQYFDLGARGSWVDQHLRMGWSPNKIMREVRSQTMNTKLRNLFQQSLTDEAISFRENVRASREVQGEVAKNLYMSVIPVGRLGGLLYKGSSYGLRFFTANLAHQKFIGTGMMQIHHRIPQYFIRTGLFPKEMLTSLSNLQPVATQLHRTLITPQWNAFIRTFPNATSSEVMKFAMNMDKQIAPFIGAIGRTPLIP